MVERVLRWAGPVAMVLLMCRLIQIAAQPVDNGDTWFHLRLGRELGWPWDWASVEHWSSFATSEWVPTQPLPELVIAGVEEVAGLAGVAWLYGASMIVLLLTVYAVGRRHASPLVAALVTGCALVAAAGTLSPRPQVISLVLLAVVTDAWLRTEDDLRPRWWLVPLTWVWAMCHGFWVIGVVIGGAVVIALGVRRRVGGRQALMLAAVPGASLLAACATPLGPELVLAPLTINERAGLISEWQRTSFGVPAPWVVVAMLVAGVALLAARRRLSLAKAMLLVLASAWLLLSVRTVAVAAMIAAPLAAAALQTLITRGRDDEPDADLRWLTGAGAALLAVLAAVVPTSADEPGSVPTAFDGRLEQLATGTVVMNDSGIGGWLAWRHPQLDLVVDGMFDAYPVEHLKAAQSATYGGPEWEEFVYDSGAEVAVLADDVALVEELTDRGWVETARDEGYVLLESPQLRR